jgi:polygalacturonase
MINDWNLYCQLARVYCQHKMQRLRLVLVICLGFLCGAICAKDYSVLDYGARGDGSTLNTLAIQAAIDDAANHGGGRVIIPKGRFVSGTIFLKSNVNLHLKKNAIILGSLSPLNYRRVAKWKALIQANEVCNIAITGSGTIDGRGARLALKIDSLFYAGEIDSAYYNAVEKRPKWNIRPQLVYSYKCNNISVSGVTLKNSACWVQTYEQCSHVKIQGIKVDSDTYWNNDGIDIVDSKNVRITHCAINAADDGICIKSEDWTRAYFCDSIYIVDCRVRSSASAIKFGTSTVSHIRNVVVRNIKVYDTYRSAIAIEAMQGGVLENILVEDVVAHNTGNAIFLRIGQIRGAKLPGTLRNITLRRIKVSVPFKRPDYAYEMRGPALPYFHNVFPSSITGIPGFPVQNVVLQDITIVYPGRGNAAYANMPTHRIVDVPEMPAAYPEFSMFGELPAWGFYIRHVEGLYLKNVKVKIRKNDYRPAFVFDDVSRLTLDGLKVKGDKKPNPLFMREVSDFIKVK